jgi:hypothetical protein
MREIEMALDTLQFITRQVEIAAPMFQQFPFLNRVAIMREEQNLGYVVRDNDFIEECRFVLNANFFEVPA